LSIAEFKIIEKCFLLAIAVVRAVMVLTPISRFFKKAHGRIFRRRIKLWYSVIGGCRPANRETISNFGFYTYFFVFSIISYPL